MVVSQFRLPAPRSSSLSLSSVVQSATRLVASVVSGKPSLWMVVVIAASVGAHDGGVCAAAGAASPRTSRTSSTRVPAIHAAPRARRPRAQGRIFPLFLGA